MNIGGARRPWAALRRPRFRRLWLSQLISTFGDQLVIVAVALFVSETAGAAAVGLVLAAYTLPLILLLLVGGVWADRRERHRVMAATDLIRAALHGLLAVLIFTGAVELWHMVAIGGLFGAAEAFYRPAYSGLVPETVSRGELQQATALGWLSVNVAQLAGPAVATALVLTAGAGYAFALDGLTFLVSATLLWRLGLRRSQSATRDPGGLRHDLARGLAEVRSRSWVWVTIGVGSGAIVLAGAPFLVLGPAVARAQYGSAAVFGLVMTALGLGALAGSFAAATLRSRRPLVLGLLALLPWPLRLSLFALGAPLWLVLPLAALEGAGVSVFQVSWLTALGERIRREALSRVSAYDWLGSFALVPLGYALAPAAAAAFGATAVLVTGASVTLVLILLALVTPAARSADGLYTARPALHAGS